MDVDVMPGEFDPANYALPQQALHKCMFPQASMYPTLHCVSNPYEFSVDGVRCVTPQPHRVRHRSIHAPCASASLG